jgi:hypothetical protein
MVFKSKVANPSEFASQAVKLVVEVVIFGAYSISIEPVITQVVVTFISTV